MSPTLLFWGVMVALAVAVVGSGLRVAQWFRLWVGPTTERPTVWSRVAATFAELGRALASRRLLRILVACGADVLLLGRLGRRDLVRYVAHMAVALGFLGLLFTHALDGMVTSKLWPTYLSTLSPWYGLRDGLGLLVVVGLVVSALRRRARRRSLPNVRGRDPLSVGLLVAILASGFALTAVKIMSAPVFYRMAEEYGGVSGPELEALRAYWAAELGVVFTDRPAEPEPALLAAGREQHAGVCEGCHVKPQTALVSYPLSRALRPAAGLLAQAKADVGLLYLHVLFCLLLLAYLPWSRFFHVIADPLSLVLSAVAPVHAAARGPRRALAFDACVRCGLCDERCSVAPLSELLSNEFVLPSAKLLRTRAVAAGRVTSGPELMRVADGALTCTECGRCTVGCPVGIDLADLWAAGRADLSSRGFAAVAVWVKSVPAGVWAERLRTVPVPAKSEGGLPRFTELTHDRHTFSPCVQCQTCTNVCPVVEHSSGEGGVDATPQKVMNLLRLGLAELALGSRMVWDCTTCYQCQEHCPAGIRVTEVLYELRNRGQAQLCTVVRPGGEPGARGGAP